MTTNLKFDLTDVMQWLETGNQKPTTKLTLDLIQEEFDELKVAETKRDKLDAITDLFWVITNYCVAEGLTPEELDKYFKIVSQSNWSKYCTSETVAQMTVDAYAKGEHWDKFGVQIEAEYRRYGDLFIVTRKSDGKILKSINYIPTEKLYV